MGDGDEADSWDLRFWCGDFVTNVGGNREALACSPRPLASLGEEIIHSPHRSGGLHFYDQEKTSSTGSRLSLRISLECLILLKVGDESMGKSQAKLT
jgi:hypothetical protein